MPNTNPCPTCHAQLDPGTPHTFCARTKEPKARELDARIKSLGRAFDVLQKDGQDDRNRIEALEKQSRDITMLRSVDLARLEALERYTSNIGRFVNGGFDMAFNESRIAALERAKENTDAARGDGSERQPSDSHGSPAPDKGGCGTKHGEPSTQALGELRSVEACGKAPVTVAYTEHGGGGHARVAGIGVRMDRIVERVEKLERSNTSAITDAIRGTPGCAPSATETFVRTSDNGVRSKLTDDDLRLAIACWEAHRESTGQEYVDFVVESTRRADGSGIDQECLRISPRNILNEMLNLRAKSNHPAIPESSTPAAPALPMPERPDDLDEPWLERHFMCDSINLNEERNGNVRSAEAARLYALSLESRLAAAEKRGKVLVEECRSSRTFDAHNAKPIHRDNYERMIDAQTRLLAARRVTDENGGLA